MKRLLRSTILVAALSMPPLCPSFAEPSMEVLSSGQSLTFTTDFIYGDAWLRVVGPGDYAKDLHLAADEEIHFSLDGTEVDGLYNWEVLVVAPGERPNRGSKRGLGKPLTSTFSGGFQLRGGVVALPVPGSALEEAGSQELSAGISQEAIPSRAPLKNVVVDDTQIVQGSQCVGLGCSSNENLGSHTVRLKENVLRMDFVDNSTGNFAGNDWRFKFNDGNTANGENYFTLRDVTGAKDVFTIEAGAGGNALYVEDDGQIGLGTSAPDASLHIVNGDSPRLRLEQDASSNFTPQGWEIFGNEVSFSIEDVTDGARLPFRILPGAGDNRLILNSTGAGIGVNNAGARAPLHVRGGGSNHNPSNASVMALFQNNDTTTDGAIISILAGNSTANAQMWFGDSDNDAAGRIIYRNGTDAMSFWTSGAERFFIEADGDLCIGCNNANGNAILHNNGASLSSGGTWTNASSRALKQDIAELSVGEAHEALAELSPVTFRYRSEPEETYVGFIAEDVPELVAMEGRSGLTAMDIVAVLTKVVQEQRRAFEVQSGELDELRSRLAALESVD